MKQGVEKWWPSGHPDGDIHDLSFLGAHQAVYVQHHEGKGPLGYRFWITHSLHCFIKDYEHQMNEEKQSLIYRASKESRPFRQHHCNLAHTRLKRTILALSESNVIHAGYSSYAIVEVDLNGRGEAFYFTTFKAFREKKKLRLHVTSAYPISEKQKDKSVRFPITAHNLLRNEQLPQPSK